MATVKQEKEKKSKKDIAYNYYLSLGYTPAQASGIVGNLVHESGLNTGIEGDKGYKGGSSFGVAQWREERLDRLKDYAKRKGRDWTDFQSQLEFVEWELNNTHKNAKKALLNSKDVYEAGEAFSDLYEIPKVKFRQNKDRQKAVVDTFKNYGNYTPTEDNFYNEEELEYNPITTDVNNFFGSKQIPTLAGVPDMPQEEEKQEKEDKDVAELKQQTQEQEFLREVQESYAQQPIQQEQPQQRQQTVAPRANYIQTFEEVSNFIQNPIVAQQGVQKKPIYVDSKNDPRYRAYQDSLFVYNNINKFNSGTKDIFNKVKNKQYDYDEALNKYLQLDKDKDIQKLQKIIKNKNYRPVEQPTQSTKDINNEPFRRTPYTFKKPTQPVEVQDIRKPNTTTGQQVKENGNKGMVFNETLISPREKLTPLQQLQPKEIVQLNSSIEPTNIDIPIPARIPTSYNVNSQRYNMAGENPYYNFNAENTDYETALRAKMAAEAFNADIQRRYGNEEALKNPKAVERLNQLRQEVNITPNYQQGGKIYAQQASWETTQSLVKAEKLEKLKRLLEDKNVVEKLKQNTQQRRSQAPTQTTRIDNTNVTLNNRPELISKAARNKTDKEIAAEREAKIDESIAYQDVPFTKDNWREVLAKTTQSTGDKFRYSNEPNTFDDYLNPAVWIGDMASNLGQAPLQAQQQDSYLPYITSIGTPLAVGAMAGIGTQNTGQFVNNLANPLAGTGTIFKYAAKKIGNDVGLVKDLIFDKNTTLNKNFIFDSKNKIYNQIEVGYKTLDNSLEQKINELGSEEGRRRLINQEKEYLQDFYYDPKNVDLEKAATESANTRIEELENIKAFGNKNKEFIYNVDKNKVGKLGITKPHIESVQYNYGIPTNNAHYEYADGVIDNPSGSKMLPGKLTLGRGFENSIPTAEHEINHALQRGRTLKIDDNLKNIVPDYKKNLSYDDINAYTYFKSGSDGQESSAFLAELRSQMKQDGFIKNTYDEITPDLIEKAKEYYGKNKNKQVFVNKGGLQGLTNTRILDFSRATPENYKIISDAMNKLPAIVPIAGASYLATQGENKQQGGTKTSNMLRVVSNMLNRGSSPKQILRNLVRMSVPRDVAQQLVQRASKPIKYNQQGGEYTESEIAFLSEIAIKDNQGQYNHPNKITEINSSNITMKGLDYPLLGISKETGETKIMKPNKDYKFGKGTKNVIEVPLKK